MILEFLFLFLRTQKIESFVQKSAMQTKLLRKILAKKNHQFVITIQRIQFEVKTFDLALKGSREMGSFPSVCCESMRLIVFCLFFFSLSMVQGNNFMSVFRFFSSATNIWIIKYFALGKCLMIFGELESNLFW